MQTPNFQHSTPNIEQLAREDAGLRIAQAVVAAVGDGRAVGETIGAVERLGQGSDRGPRRSGRREIGRGLQLERHEGDRPRNHDAFRRGQQFDVQRALFKARDDERVLSGVVAVVWIAFTVTQPGDLRLTETLSTNLALPGQQVIYTTSITNLGPTIQSGVRLTNSFQSGLTLHSAVPSQGACGIAGSVVSCALGIITNNRSATVTFTVSAPLSGVFTNQATVRSIEGDPNNGNNTVQNTLIVASLEQRTLNVELLSAPKRVVVSWPVSFVPFKLQTASNFLPAGTIWTTITPLPQPQSGTNRFTNSAPNASGGYYRLRYP